MELCAGTHSAKCLKKKRSDRVHMTIRRRGSDDGGALEKGCFSTVRLTWRELSEQKVRIVPPKLDGPNGSRIQSSCPCAAASTDGSAVALSIECGIGPIRRRLPTWRPAPVRSADSTRSRAGDLQIFHQIGKFDYKIIRQLHPDPAKQMQCAVGSVSVEEEDTVEHSDLHALLETEEGNSWSSASRHRVMGECGPRGSAFRRSRPT